MINREGRGEAGNWGIEWTQTSETGPYNRIVSRQMTGELAVTRQAHEMIVSS